MRRVAVEKKADIEEVNQALALKADIVNVNELLEAHVNDVNDALVLKASTDDVAMVCYHFMQLLFSVYSCVLQKQIQV